MFHQGDGEKSNDLILIPKTLGLIPLMLGTKDIFSLVIFVFVPVVFNDIYQSIAQSL